MIRGPDEAFCGAGLVVSETFRFGPLNCLGVILKRISVLTAVVLHVLLRGV